MRESRTPMVHLRIVSPAERTDEAREALESTASVCNVVVLRGAARRPDGDVILCDVAREDGSVVVEDLKRLRRHETGSIALQSIDTLLSAYADAAVRNAPGAPADAVVWEEVEARTEENVGLSGVFLLFFVLASLLAAVGILLDSAILIVGAMVVGPESGPLAGLCVALVQRKKHLAQLALNLACIILAGTTVLAVQRALYHRRRMRHLDSPPAGDRTMGA